MPLQGSNMQRFVQNRESGGPQPEPGKRSVTPQHRHERSRQRSNDAVERKTHGPSPDGNGRDEVMRRDASRLKLPVPNTLARSKSNSTKPADKSGAGGAAPIAQNNGSRTVPNMQLPRQPIVSAFDDTQSIHLDDSTSIADDQDATTKFRFDLHDTGFPPRSRHESSAKKPSSMYAGSLSARGKKERPVAHIYGWQAEVDAERHLQGEPPRYGKHVNHLDATSMNNNEGYDDGYEPDGEYPEDEAVWDNTPSRTRMLPEPKATPFLSKEIVKNESRKIVLEEPPSPPLPKQRKPVGDVALSINTELPHQQYVNRFKLYKTLENNSPTKLAETTKPSRHDGPQPGAPKVHPPPFSSKVSSYHESSSEEDQIPPAGGPDSLGNSKRIDPDHDLDFDLEELKTKAIADLDATPFTSDPSVPPIPPALDMNGNPVTLTAKLTNLTKIGHEDQRQLFRSLTDAERAQAATWFLEKFQAEVQKLTAIRIERRKIALRFELEVRKREKRIETKKADVDQELAGLKKGGGELIGGKAGAK